MPHVNPIDPEMQKIFLSPGVRRVSWEEPGLQICRFRLLSDPGYPFMDVSYCWGFVRDEPVAVELPFSSLPKTAWKTTLVEYAKKAGVNARRLGMFDNFSYLS